MFAYAALLLAGFSATNVATVQPSDLAFGREQVEQFIHDRPDAGAVINRNPTLKEQLALLFADDGQSVDGRAQHVHWDNKEPISPISECLSGWGDRSSRVQVTSRWNYSPTDRCVFLIFELNNVRNGRRSNALVLMARQKQISREDYAISKVRGEFEAAKRTKEFIRNYPFAGGNAKDDPEYYAYATIPIPEDFSDRMRHFEGGDEPGNLQYFREQYDRITSPKSDSQSDNEKIKTLAGDEALLTSGDPPLYFAHHLKTDSSKTACDNANDSIPTRMATRQAWGDALDWTVVITYLALIALVPMVGFTSIGLHIRDYLRSLGRALVLIGHYSRELPEWIRRDRPRCIQALDLHLPCTTAEVLAAYRKKVKLLHPDRGGDPREFLRLQEHFEQAMALAGD